MISCTQGYHVQRKSLLGSRGDGKEGSTGSPPGIALVPVLSLGIPGVNLPCDDKCWMLVMAKVIVLGFTCCLAASSFLSLILFTFKFFLFNKKRTTALVTLYLIVTSYMGTRRGFTLAKIYMYVCVHIYIYIKTQENQEK